MSKDVRENQRVCEEMGGCGRICEDGGGYGGCGRDGQDVGGMGGCERIWEGMGECDKVWEIMGGYWQWFCYDDGAGDIFALVLVPGVCAGTQSVEWWKWIT